MSDLLVEGPMNGVLTLTLNRPDKRNALSSALIDALHQALESADLDAGVRVVAIRGAGPDFCAGADLAELLASAERSPAENEREALRLGELFLRIRRFPRPVVAVVQGRALAGGAGLATACDLVLAGRGAQLGYPEISRGFVPAMVLTILRRVAGERAAFELAVTGRVVGADEAHRLGLVTSVHDDAELDVAAAGRLAALAAQSPGATALTKQLCYELDGLGFEEGVRLGARVNALARTTPDFKAGVARFLAK
jgi:methylglutaconyl-CoA hydratase